MRRGENNLAVHGYAYPPDGADLCDHSKRFTGVCAMNYAERPTPLRPDHALAAKAEARSWHRCLAARALAILKRGDAARLCKAAWPNDPRAAELLQKTAQTPTSRTDFPVYAITESFRSLAPGSSALRLLDRGRILDMSGITTITVPDVASLPPQAVFVGENAPAAVVVLPLGGAVLGPTRKIQIEAALSNELNDATPDTAAAVIGRVLADVTNRSIDAVAFGTAASDSTKPAGLLYNVAPVTAAAASVDAMADDLAALVGAIGAAGVDTNNCVFIAGPRESAFMKTKVGPRFDYAIFPTMGLPSKTVACFAGDALMSGYEGGIEVEIGRHTSVHYESSTPQPIVGTGGVVAAPVKSAFQSNLLVIKVRSLGAWAIAPGGAAVVNSINW
jgi:hypothetical protein